jgi:hypothetical protein
MPRNEATGAIAIGVCMNSPSVHQTVYWFVSAGRRAWLGLAKKALPAINFLSLTDRCGK